MGFGSWLKKATTPHKSLRGILGNSFLDEVGTVGGFLVGGPGGAAAGRGLGTFGATGNVGKGLRGAAEGFVLGSGASALGVPGAGSLNIPGGIPGTSGGGFGNFGSTLRNLGGAGRGALNWLTDKDAGAHRVALLTSGLGAGASAYGARQAGRVADNEQAFIRERATRNDPMRDRMMELFLQRIGGA